MCIRSESLYFIVLMGNSTQVRHEGQNFKMLFSQTSSAKFLEMKNKMIQTKYFESYSTLKLTLTLNGTNQGKNTKLTYFGVFHESNGTHFILFGKNNNS